ncbi:efflux RND transporter periplasmic adaptor subunit [Bacteriovorax sp. Seq25_V]|uniref:efflux RND transporter periplasmic adaptor subunit n=1 Tax=Bacteriovorax sp. Seq25_V TaxID=1201288 RepID=UPI00038A3FF1|nr:efflux RND transporter periplasmic adaptor subunit [Bacteriovorax sp. Seq25_V]EQC45491.1 HlyD family secretion protein [Bacteriovorax sp. Seq25_V]
MNKIFLVIIPLLFLVFSCDKKAITEMNESEHKHEEVYYTCAMHPQIKEKAPGKCPICHMNLTKVVKSKTEQEVKKVAPTKKWACENYPDVTSDVEGPCPLDGTPMILVSNHESASSIVAKLKLQKSTLAHFSPSFFPVTKMVMNKKIRLLGTVLQSEDKESSIPARVGGRVEKVYIKSTGSFVKSGAPVIEIYSPKLITAGEEYLIAKRSFQKSATKEFREMIKQSEQRLQLWGIKPQQYEEWFKRGEVPKSITLFSEATGIVRKKNATVGKYFQEGQNFFELSDLSEVWVEMDVYEHDAGLVEMGQVATLAFTSIPGEKVEGEIDFISPVLSLQSRTLKIRTTIKNTQGKLKPGMLADAIVDIKFKGMPLVVPRSAVIDTGRRKVVWLKVSDSEFQAKEIESGLESEGYIEVKSGLEEGEEVVVDGNFLLDAQAQLFGGYVDFGGQL